MITTNNRALRAVPPRSCAPEGLEKRQIAQAFCLFPSVPVGYYDTALLFVASQGLGTGPRRKTR